ncbi:hypothetical protein [Lactiplantibacillus daowaiensis]|uniref:Uncharacterized protein n=1 Tax=Lactiplantibacillus daowaiensis TaxID=2559918 RepID=A0ABW1S3H9_9LACO|nr:hypothetical protein [Lactiplantibacillus daowaiensis]
MRQYALQLNGHDFEPMGAWSTDAQVVLTKLVARDDVDLLMWDPDTDMSEIYEQYALATLVTRLENSAYARLLETMTQVFTQLGQPVTATLQRQWYLTSYLASLTHQSLLNTAAALLSLTVYYLKTPPLADTTSATQQLRGLADQARCWLLAAKVSDLQLLATPEPLQKLVQHLLGQTEALDYCCVSGQSRSWQLASDAYWLSRITTDQFSIKRLQNVMAFRLLRAAYLEHSLD